MCDMTPSYVGHDSLIRVTWLIESIVQVVACVVTLICVTWLIHMHDMACTCVRHDSFIHVTRLTRLNDAVAIPICVTWIVHMHDMTHICVRHESRAAVADNHSRKRPDFKWLDLKIGRFSLRLLTRKPDWNVGDSRENVFHMYGDSRENVLEMLAVVIILSPISSVRGTSVCEYMYVHPSGRSCGNCVTCIHESCHTCAWIMSRLWMSHGTHTSHITNCFMSCKEASLQILNESCSTCEWVYECLHMNASCNTYDRVIPHIQSSHVTHMNESRPAFFHAQRHSRLYPIIVSHIWNETCTYEPQLTE